MHYNNMVAIFVDIIGYKNTTDFDQKYELHRLFHEEVAIHEERQLDIPHVIYDRKVFGFSDCAFFFFYYKDGIEESRKDNTQLSYIAAYNVSLTILRLMEKGYLARGGLTFGEVFIDDLGFFGPAVERAHEIESKEAFFPRLQFDHDIGKKIYEWEHDLSNKDPALLDMYTDVPYVSEQEDSSYFVNPFNVLQKSSELTVGSAETITLDSVKRSVLERADKDLIEYANNEKITKKLEWIKKYTLSKPFLLKESISPYSFSFMKAPNNVG
ncbi:hypothetical protein ACOYR1_08505 [Thalassotalea piscium]